MQGEEVQEGEASRGKERLKQRRATLKAIPPTWPVDQPPMKAEVGAVREVRADWLDAPWPDALPCVAPCVALSPLVPARAALVVAGPLLFWASASTVPMQRPETPSQAEMVWVEAASPPCAVPVALCSASRRR